MNNKNKIEKARLDAVDMFKKSIGMMFVHDKKSFQELKDFINTMTIEKENE